MLSISKCKHSWKVGIESVCTVGTMCKKYKTWEWDKDCVDEVIFMEVWDEELGIVPAYVWFYQVLYMRRWIDIHRSEVWRSTVFLYMCRWIIIQESEVWRSTVLLYLCRWIIIQESEVWRSTVLLWMNSEMKKYECGMKKYFAWVNEVVFIEGGDVKVPYCTWARELAFIEMRSKDVLQSWA